jgi:hypothetical protein
MPPTVDFHGQPYDADATAGAFLRRVLCDAQFDRFTAVVAWARFRGIRRISDELDALQARGGQSTLIVGIDEGIATRPGLILELRHFSKVYVLHDRPGLTFHPKLYLAEGAASAALLVGSGNLTAGGLFSNYEAALEANFALPAEEESPALSRARAYIDRLLSDQNICLKLDEDLVEKLVDDPRYGVSKKELRRSRSGQLPPGLEPEDVDPTADEAGGDADVHEPLFGASAHRKPPIPPLPPDAQRELRELEGESEEPPPRPAPAGSRARRASSEVAPAGRAKREILAEVRRAVEPVFIAELSKSRGATQANFHVEHYEGYFGAVRGAKTSLALRQVRSDGSLAPTEPRETVEVASQNYRLELDGLRGRQYPAGNLAPITAFVQLSPKLFYYQALWPSDEGHAALVGFLDSAEGVRRNRSRMRQRRATIEELEEAWPESPLLIALEQEE